MPCLQRTFLTLSHVDITKDTLHVMRPQVNSYGVHDARTFFPCDSALTICVIRTLRTAVLEPTAKPSHTHTGECDMESTFNPRMIFLILLSVLLNPLNTGLNPICYLLALLGAHHFLHVSRIRVKSLTLRLLMSYMERLFLVSLDHTQRRSTVGRTPLDE